MDPMAIHRAVQKDDLVKVKELVEAGASVDSCDGRRRTPLLLAAACGHHAVVEFLINCKLNPENRNPPVLLNMDENEGAIGLFLQHDEKSYTLLHFASQHGWADIAQIIIEKGSESDMVNAATKRGSTPLMLAAMRSHEDVAALLLRSGADVNQSNISGLTALHFAAFHRASRNGFNRIVKLLLQEEGLDLIPQDLSGRTPLHLACLWGGCEKVIKQLLVAGTDANFIDEDGETPLSIYLNELNPSLKVINLFVQHGAFFLDRDYSTILWNHVLRENVLKNVDLCTQSVINKFSYQTLPVLYSCPYFASTLPSKDNLMLNTSQKDEVKNFVRRDIQQNTFCNVVGVRPTSLGALCVQCLAAYIPVVCEPCVIVDS